MRTHRLATLAAASTVALLALGGTAFALGADDTPPPAVTSTATATPTTTAAASSVGGARASAIAVDRVGGGQVTKVERELEHGGVEWKVAVASGGVRHEIRVDDASGTVVRASSSSTPRSDDGPLHDVGDDHGGRSGGVSGHGSDDGAAHDGGDDRGRGSDD